MDVAVSFLEQFSDGEFDAADEFVHLDGPLEGATDFAMLSSLLFTDFLSTFILGAIPTEVTETTVIEEGPTTASIDATLDIAGVWTRDDAIIFVGALVVAAATLGAFIAVGRFF